MSSPTESHYPVVQSDNPALKLLDDKIVDGFLASYGNDKTRQGYRHSLRQFRNWVKSLPAEHRGFSLVAEFKAYLQSRIEAKDPHDRLSSYSASLYMAVIKRYVGFLNQTGLLEHNPAESVKGFRQHATHFRRALDRNCEVPRLFDVIDKSTGLGFRDYALITLLAHTGIRSSELAGADYGDLDSAEGRPILWIRSKGKLGKSEYVFITEVPYKALLAYLGQRKGLDPRSPLFVAIPDEQERRLSTRAIRYRVDYWLAKAGLKTARVTMHSLRHTAAVAALKNGADIRAVQSMLRHSDPKTTMVYLQDISRHDRPAEDSISYGQPR